VRTAEATDLFPNLFQVLGGYLHQDFDCDFASADEALRTAAEEQGREQVAGAVREIDALLAGGFDDRTLIAIVERLTTGYSPVLDGWEIRPWLEHARAILAVVA
jgi:hypothetical protein